MKIEFVHDFSVLNDILITLHGKITKRTVSLWRTTQHVTDLCKDEIIAGAKIEYPFLWTYSKDQTFQWVIEDKDPKETKISLPNFYPLFIIDDLIVGDRKVEEENSICVFPLEMDSVLWSKGYSSTMIDGVDNDIFMIRYTSDLEPRSIICLNLLTGEEKWTYTLKDRFNWVSGDDDNMKGEFYKIIGLVEGSIWLVLNSGVILSFNTQTGDLENELCKPDVFPNSFTFSSKGNQVNVFNRSTFLDNKKGIFFGLKGNFYWEISTLNEVPSFELFDVSDSSEKHQVQLNNLGGHDDEFIFFYEGGESNRFGVFSKEDKVIVASSEIEDAKGTFPAIRKMEYSNEKLYILDFHNNLHIINPPLA